MNTTERLIDAAERLFSEQGYDATSLRQLIAEAGVNLASIHYHFGSKQELLDAIIARRAGPVNQERRASLDALEKRGTPPVEKVLPAFLEPMARAAERHPQFVRVMGRVHSEGMLQDIVQRNFQSVI